MQNEKQISSRTQKVFVKKTDEKILVVKKNILFAYQTTQGIKPINFERYQKLITKHQEFLWRSKVEENTNYKQIIPYLVFTHDNKFFVMKRKSDASETRLQNKLSLGIGGHIKKQDLKKASIIDWSQREFDEEVNYKGALDIKTLGILNDETDAVGQVHTGFVFMLHGDNANITIRSEHKEGYMLTLEECIAQLNQFENWSKFIINYLRKA